MIKRISNIYEKLIQKKKTDQTIFISSNDVFINRDELQKIIFDTVMNEEEIDRLYNSSVFSLPENTDCRGAMKHGMIIASLLTSKVTNMIYVKGR